MIAHHPSCYRRAHPMADCNCGAEPGEAAANRPRQLSLRDIVGAMAPMKAHMLNTIAQRLGRRDAQVRRGLLRLKELGSITMEPAPNGHRYTLIQAVPNLMLDEIVPENPGASKTGENGETAAPVVDRKKRGEYTMTPPERMTDADLANRIKLATNVEIEKEITHRRNHYFHAAWAFAEKFACAAKDATDAHLRAAPRLEIDGMREATEMLESRMKSATLAMRSTPDHSPGEAVAQKNVPEKAA